MSEEKKPRTFKVYGEQGEIRIKRISKEELPPDMYAKQRQSTSEGELVIAHSETSHHHVIAAPPTVAQLFGAPSITNPLRSILEVRGKDVILEHKRPWDTHEPLKLEPGYYRVTLGREATIDGWRKTED